MVQDVFGLHRVRSRSLRCCLRFWNSETRVEKFLAFFSFFSPVLSPLLKNGDTAGDVCVVSVFRRDRLYAEAYSVALRACEPSGRGSVLGKDHLLI